MAGAVPDKVLAPLAGRPVFSYSAAAFAASGVADLYVVVYRDRSQMTALSAFAPTPVPAREGRQRAPGLRLRRARRPARATSTTSSSTTARAPSSGRSSWSALHKVVRREQAVVLAHRVTDTIKERRDGGRLRTIDRSRLWAMETPQVFSKALIERAYARVRSRALRVTDDAAAVELLGRPVALLENSHPNPKLTTPQDLAYLEFLLAPAP
jgi:2-C-methyl-D-erythritol 4-phosphate cytidylyltransferase